MVGSKVASTPIYVPDVSITTGFYPKRISLVLKGVLQTPWIFACAVSSAVYDMDNLEKSTLEISFEVFYSSKLLAFHPPN